MTTNASVLSVRDLAIALPPGADRAHAVEHISFDVPPGKIVCLLGESGSGKSVIANAVMGLLPRGSHPCAARSNCRAKTCSLRRKPACAHCAGRRWRWCSRSR
jgi:ABC-type glutathione transport system ATPase component